MTADPSDVPALMAVAADAAGCGLDRALEHWRRVADLSVETKQDPDDLVTEADRDTEDVIRTRLRKTRSVDAMTGEEREPDDGTSGVRWIVDPIDGTTGFVYGRTDWAVSVAALDEATGEVLAGAVAEPAPRRITCAGLGAGTWSADRCCRVTPAADLARAVVEINLGTRPQRRLIGPVLGTLAAGVRDLRRGGTAAGALANVATGRADAAWLPGLQLWDGAAGLLLVHEAGGLVGDQAGPTAPRWPASGDVIATSPTLWADLVAATAGG